MSNRHTLAFTAAPEHIDVMGHVNNGVWLQWVQDLAAAHWHSVASAEQLALYSWVVTRHEIDYRGNIGPGETALGETFIPDPPGGARFDRRTDFRALNHDGTPGKIIVSARTTWALLDAASARLVRVREDVVGLFRPFPGAEPRVQSG